MSRGSVQCSLFCWAPSSLQDMRVRTDYGAKGRYYLDVPQPALLDTRSWRCRTCGYSCSPDFADVKRVIPEILKGTVRKQREVWFSPRWLLHTLLKFQETMNVRATRRFILDLYSANMLHEQQRWFLNSVPRVHQISAVVSKAFQDYLPELASRMEAEIHPFSGGALRGDGNFKLPARLRDSTKTCLYAWLGSDAAVLTPPVLLESEKLPHLLPAVKDIAKKLMLGSR